jgi:hypothetical protein
VRGRTELPRARAPRLPIQLSKIIPAQKSQLPRGFLLPTITKGPNSTPNPRVVKSSAANSRSAIIHPWLRQDLLSRHRYDVSES